MSFPDQPESIVPELPSFLDDKAWIKLDLDALFLKSETLSLLKEETENQILKLKFFQLNILDYLMPDDHINSEEAKANPRTER